LSIGELQILLQASQASTRDIGSIEDVEDEDTKESSNEMEIDLPDN
jgi:hypothetical protein